MITCVYGPTSVSFEDLPANAAFIDREGDLCIKLRSSGLPYADNVVRLCNTNGHEVAVLSFRFSKSCEPITVVDLEIKAVAPGG